MYMSILDNKFKEINDYKHNAESESKFIRSHNQTGIFIICTADLSYNGWREKVVISHYI